MTLELLRAIREWRQAEKRHALIVLGERGGDKDAAADRVARATNALRAAADRAVIGDTVEVTYQKLQESVKLYHELLYAVARRFPGETRHQTALRYIREKEQQDISGPTCDAKPFRVH